MTLTFDTSAFEADLAALKRDIERNEVVAVKNLVHEAAEATNEHGYQNKTGRLAGTREENVGRGGDGIAAFIRWPAEYAKWVDDGRGPVRPVNKQFLRYYIGGRVIFSKYSKPSKPARFSEHARMVLDTRASDVLQSGVDTAIQAHP